MIQLLWKTLRQFCKILNIKLPCVCVLSCFSPVWHLVTLWTVVRQAFCLWDSPGKNTGVGCHFLLQGIFPTQGLKLHLLWLLHWEAVLYHKHHWGRPHNPATALEGKYPKELKAGTQTGICMLMFLAALLTIAEDRKNNNNNNKTSKGLVLPGKDLEKVDLIMDNLSAIPDWLLSNTSRRKLTSPSQGTRQ